MILVTGGAGYIGSHAVLELLSAGHDVLVLDNLCNGSEVALARVEQLAGRRVQFVKGDVRNRALLNALFASYPVTAVLHFAGLKAVAQSVRRPMDYYANNMFGTLNLCQAMARAHVFNLVFSSSATVYGEPARMPIIEDHGTGKPANPYGRSKLMIEELLSDLALADPRWNIAVLRYFNPIGAHQSGLIGEAPNGRPNNLLPCLTEVASGQRAALTVYGNDYPTVDGTCVRDYIHVLDLAEGHLKSLQVLQGDEHGLHVWNLGSGNGYSVLQIISAFEDVTGLRIPYRFAPRRAGDVAECRADASKAGRELSWRAQRELTQMLIDSWRWQTHNPWGYRPQPAPLLAVGT